MYKVLLACLIAGFVVYSASNVHADFNNIRAQHSSQLERTIDDCR